MMASLNSDIKPSQSLTEVDEIASDGVPVNQNQDEKCM
jgi:hypothetical protein